ncbi:hypothetical protein BGX38DRAFT_1145596 [Terfezia claveryi]|nr:hypothetical protein BGX38DRAFT_1145596 [Terfezia claveryi]
MSTKEPATGTILKLRNQVIDSLKTWKMLFYNSLEDKYLWCNIMGCRLHLDIILRVVTKIVEEWDPQDITDLDEFQKTRGMTLEEFKAMVYDKVDSKLCELFVVTQRN